ncbi:MAG: hypothetical protein GY730_08420 [bacterium]|nr:hypothetical protein [bacterium]
MIMIISDVHCRYSVVNRQIEHARRISNSKISAVVVTGDLGLFAYNLRKFFIKENKRFKVPLFFVEGNHEDFDRIDDLIEDYGEYFTYLPRGTVHNIDGFGILSLGGASYMDILLTPEASEIKDEDIDRSLKNNKDTVDIIITHDCPSGIGVPKTKGMEYYGETGFMRSSELVDKFKPRFWFFGHHHKWFEHHINNTGFYGLAECWRGYYLLDKGFKLNKVVNEIEIDTESILKKIKKILKL